MLKPFRYFFALLVLVLLTGCIGNTTPEGASYIRVSSGEYGGRFLKWLGLAGEGGYCQLTSSEEDYEWTQEDLEFFKDQCPDDSEAGRMVRLIEAAGEVVATAGETEP